MNTETALSWKCTHSSIAAKGGNKKFITPFSNTFVLKNCAFKSEKIKHMWRRWGTAQTFFLTFIHELEKQIILKKLLNWANKKQIILIFTMLQFLKKYKEKHLQISLSKSWWYDLQFLRYRAKYTEFGNFRSFFVLLSPKTPKIKILKNEKICWRYHHFTHVYQKSQS